MPAQLVGSSTDESPLPQQWFTMEGCFLCLLSFLSLLSFKAFFLSPGGTVPIPRKLLHNNLTDMAPKHLLLQTCTGAQGRPSLSRLYGLGSCSVGVWCFPRTCRDWHEGCCYSHALDAGLPHQFPTSSSAAFITFPSSVLAGVSFWKWWNPKYDEPRYGEPP